MSNFMQQFYGYAGLIVVCLFGYGAWGLITNGDATAYDLANKERVSATVTDLQTIRVDKIDQCQISLYQSGRNLSVVTDDTNPCYQNNNTPIHVGSSVQVEYWNGKPTTVYLGDVSWPTSDNPAHKVALAAAALFFGGLIGIVVAAIGAIHFLIWFSSRQHSSPSA